MLKNIITPVNHHKFFFSVMCLLLILFSDITLSQTAHSKTTNIPTVVSDHHLASDVGLKIMNQGGNAIDAAVAVGYALAVVNPCCGNIGGGGFMMIHLANGKNIFLNFREKAPLVLDHAFVDKKGYVIPNKTIYGFAAVATPGTVLGLETARKHYGRLSREALIAPAIQLAQKGFVLTAPDVKILNEQTDYFKKQKNVASIFLKNGRPYHSGERLVQKELAKTLREISKEGPKVFYHGNVAKQLVHSMRTEGGLITYNDLARYKIEYYKPVMCTYRGYTVLSAPPPSSGGVTLCETLNILEGFPLQRLGYHTAASTHVIVEAMRYAFADRNQYLGDPNFVNNPTQRLTSKDYAAKIRSQIKKYFHVSPEKISRLNLLEGDNTTHYSIIDQYGNAVSVTYTLNSAFGAKVIAGNTGFFLNNEMDDFTVKPNIPNQFGLIQSSLNKIEPGKTPLSSMTPTIILKNGKIKMVVGSPGGPRIITSVLLSILNVIDYKMDIQSAVDASRFHHQLYPDWITAEPQTFSSIEARKLRCMGYKLKTDKPWSAVEAITVDQRGVDGGSDKRRPAGKVSQ